MTRWRDARATELFGIADPILLGAFGGVSSVDLVAIVSEAGGLGAYGLYGYDGERITRAAADIRERTSKPFALNLWLPHDDDHELVLGERAYAQAVRSLAPFFDEVGMTPPPKPARYLPSFDEQIAAVFEARPAALSFVFGVPSPKVLERAKSLGIVTVGTATTVAEAVALDAAGVDAIVASGAEAGGHRVSFLRAPGRSLVGTFALVPQVVDAVGVPVVAAGGIADGRGVAAALTLGASAAQVGTAFLATDQSAAVPAYREVLRSERARETELTTVPSGRLARAIPNRLTAHEGAPAPFPAQNWLTGRFRAAAAERGDVERMSLWAGQAARLSTETDARELYARLVGEATALLP